MILGTLIFAFLTQPPVIMQGNVYCSDGQTPVQGIGGKDWKIDVQDANGSGLAFKVKYIGHSYEILVDTAKIPVDKSMRVYAHHPPLEIDRAFEGLNAVGRLQVVDIVLSAEAPKKN